MQLWLKEVTYEYAMNKPPEGEIYPNTRAVEFNLHPDELPEGVNHTVPENTVTWNLEKGFGKMVVDVEGHSRRVLDRIALMWRVAEIHRTHCPKCWEKIRGSRFFLGTEVSEHISMFCPADRDWDDRFPREED